MGLVRKIIDPPLITPGAPVSVEQAAEDILIAIIEVDRPRNQKPTISQSRNSWVKMSKRIVVIDLNFGA